MSHTTTPLHPGLVSPAPHRESRLALALSRLERWTLARLLFLGLRPAARSSHPRPTRLGARPLMAAVWYGSLGAGPLYLPEQPAMVFEPGDED